jgi:hypothetical protein
MRVEKQTKLGLSVLIVAASLALGAQTVRAAPVAACVNPGGTGGCFSTIQAAILSVPGNPGIAITIADGTYQENIAIAQGQQIQLTGDTSNPGAVVIDGGRMGNTVTVSENSGVIISSLTITNGSSSQGGAINSGGTLGLEDTIIENSSVSGPGGCIYQSRPGQFFMVLSSVEGCTAGSGGGAIYLAGGPAATIESSYIGNSKTTSGDGGGFQIAAGSADIINSTFFNDSAQNGGGLALEKGKGTVSGFNDTFDNNSATGSGGGVYQAVGAAAIKLNNSSFGGNSAGASGGAIDSSGKKNTVSLSNTILGADVAASGPECAGILKSKGWNLIANTAGCSFSGKTKTNITGQSPMFADALQCLTNLGLNTPCALPIQAGSPAVSSGNPGKPAAFTFGAACVSTDALGTTRSKGKCDIGAFQIP